MIKLDKREFYYLELGDNKIIFTDYDEAVKEVREELKDKETANIDEDDVSLFIVEIGDEWKIQETSWFQFALELMKSDN